MYIDALSDRELRHSGHRPVQSVNYNIVDVPANHVQDSTNQSEEKNHATVPGDSQFKKGNTRETFVL